MVSGGIKPGPEPAVNSVPIEKASIRRVSSDSRRSLRCSARVRDMDTPSSCINFHAFGRQFEHKNVPGQPDLEGVKIRRTPRHKALVRRFVVLSIGRLIFQRIEEEPVGAKRADEPIGRGIVEKVREGAKRGRDRALAFCLADRYRVKSSGWPAIAAPTASNNRWSLDLAPWGAITRGGSNGWVPCSITAGAAGEHGTGRALTTKDRPPACPFCSPRLGFPPGANWLVARIVPCAGGLRKAEHLSA